MAHALSDSTFFCSAAISSYSSGEWEARYKRVLGSVDSLSRITPGRKIYYYKPDGKFYESNVGVGNVCQRMLGGWIGGKVLWVEEGAYRGLWGLSIKDTTEALLYVKQEMAQVLAIARKWAEEKSLDPVLQKKIAKIRELLPVTQEALTKLRTTYKIHAKWNEIARIIDDFCKDLLSQTSQVLTTFCLPLNADTIASMCAFLQVKRAEKIEGEVGFIKKGEGKPWTIAITQGGNIYLHTGAPILPPGEVKGGFKKDKRAFGLQGEVAKLSTPMYAGDKAAAARNEEAYLKRVQEKKLPNVVEFYDIVYYVKHELSIQIIYMKYYQNLSLYFAYERLKDEPLKIKRIIVEILNGLAALHKEGIVHLDIKPENILLNDQDKAYVADFGTARDCNAKLHGIGTSVYMAPENNIWGRAGAHLDIWAFGMMMYGLLLGTVKYVHPFGPWPWFNTAKSPMDLDRLNREQKAIDFPEPPEHDVWWHACWETLKIKPSERPSAQELYERLSKQLDQELATVKK